MAYTRSITISGINIVTHPHSPEGYVKLFRAMFAQRLHIGIRGAQHLMIGELQPMEQGQSVLGLRGRLYRFVCVDKDAKWFNVARHDEATPEEVEKINIPDELRPNTEMFDFVFYPKGHTFYLNRRSNNKVAGKIGTLSAGKVNKLLKALCSLQLIREMFGNVEITVLPDKNKLDRILRLPQLRKLTIEVTRPNPDEIGSAYALLNKRLESMKARRLRQELSAEPHESLQVDEETRILAQVAATNGKVVGFGYNAANQRVEQSTVDCPWSQRIAYDPALQAEIDVLASSTVELPGHAA